MSTIDRQHMTRGRKATIALLVTLILSLPVAALAAVISTNIYFVEEGMTETEDVYVAASAARILGTVEGDLVIAAGEVTVVGAVTGDVIVASQGRVTVSGTVGGSLRGFARDVTISGSVVDDVAIVALTVGVSGSVGRDVLLLAGTLTIDGDVGRDVLGRAQVVTLDGDIDGDVDVMVATLTLGTELSVGGDVIYRSNADARIAPTVEVGGSLTKLSSRASFIFRSILLFVTIIHFLSFLFAGLVLLWLFRGTMSRSIATITARPWRSFGVGLLAVVVIPIIVGLLVVSLVGLPVGLLLFGMFVLSLFFAPVPTVTAVGHRLLSARGALFGGFVLGAVVWRGLIWALPVIGVLLYVVSTVMGLGAFVLTFIEQRGREDDSEPLLPVLPPRRDAVAASTDVPESGEHEGWEPPLAPTREIDDARPDSPTE